MSRRITEVWPSPPSEGPMTTSRRAGRVVRTCEYRRLSIRRNQVSLALEGGTLAASAPSTRQLGAVEHAHRMTGLSVGCRHA